MNENKMGTAPVNKLVISMSLPMMLAMLVQALYNIVDSIFVSRISENALTAVSLAFPVQSLMIAVAVGTAVGINALLSKTLGEKDFEKADKVAVNGIFLGFLSFLVFAVSGFCVAEVFLKSQTEVEEIVHLGVQYLDICCCGSIGVFMQIIMERLLQSTGKTIYTLLSQGTGAVINIILDPILIFGLLGCPELGVSGAAVATVAGQIVSTVLAVYFNVKKNKELNLSLKKFRPDFKIIGAIYKVGVPSIIMQAIGSFMIYGMNRILSKFGETAMAVFGIYFKLQSFVFMPVFGLNNGIVPIIAYNYGAGKKERVRKTIKSSVIYATLIMIAGIVLMQGFPNQILHMFDASERMLRIGVPALRIISVSFIFAGFGIVVGSAFQALGNGVYSMITSIVRQIVVLLPAAYLLSLSGILENVWWSFPIAEIFSMILTAVFLYRIDKNIISKINSIQEKTNL